MSFGILITFWTARIAMAYYALAIAAFLLRRRQLAQWAWTLGVVFFLGHVIAAFQAVHHWSHSEAFAETARQSRATTGFDSGAGLWLNYLFAAFWTADAAWMWIAPHSRQARPRWISWTLHGFLFFMVFNGTIAFAHGVTPWVSTAAFVGLLLLAWRAKRQAAVCSGSAEAGSK